MVCARACGSACSCPTLAYEVFNKVLCACPRVNCFAGARPGEPKTRHVANHYVRNPLTADIRLGEAVLCHHTPQSPLIFRHLESRIDAIRVLAQADEAVMRAVKEYERYSQTFEKLTAVTKLTPLPTEATQ